MVVKPFDPSLGERLKEVFFTPLMIYGFLKNEMKYYHHVEASALENQMQSILAFFNTPNSASQ